MLLTSNQQTTFCLTRLHMTLQTTLTSSYNIVGFLNLRQKAYICIYAHIDINKIHKSKKAGQLLL